MDFYLTRPVPGLRELPWDKPLNSWIGQINVVQEAPKGASHHPVIFVNFGGDLYVLKEFSSNQAEEEFNNLVQAQNFRIPAITPIGFIKFTRNEQPISVLISEYLDYSLPYSMLFESPDLHRYKESLLDAIAGLLVQLHLSGIYWGDCSLSNTLFRRDAGTLQAYLVDAETVKFTEGRVEPELRSQDIENMVDNISGELLSIISTNLFTEKIPLSGTTSYIQLKYQRLWEELTKEEIIPQDEQFRIQDRIRLINDLGFSVGSVSLAANHAGTTLKIQVMVTDRHFHHDQLLSLTGIEAQAMQAEKMMNEIMETRASLSFSEISEVSMSVAAFHWQEKFYKPIISLMSSSLLEQYEPPEFYCQVLEHKWFLSEKEKRDVGHHYASLRYLEHVDRSG